MTGWAIRYIFCSAIASQKDAAAHEQSELAKQSLTQTAVTNNKMNYISNKKTKK
jgi:hypothetical protein